MYGWHKWIEWMNNDAHTTGKPCSPVYFELDFHGFCHVSKNYRSIYTAFFKNISVGNYPGFSPTAFCPVPFIFKEFNLAITGFQRSTNIVLHLLNDAYPIFFYFCIIHFIKNVIGSLLRVKLHVPYHKVRAG